LITPPNLPEAYADPRPRNNHDVPPDEPTTPSTPITRSDLVDALLSASRALVGLAARSLADLDADVTLPQYRTLVVIATRGPQRVVDIAAELGVNPSTGTRMCDRLIRKGLARRTRSTTDRRAVRLSLTPAGRGLVEDVTRRRRDELTRIVTSMPDGWHEPLATALRAFATAAGEPPEQEWWLGWADTRSEPADPAAAADCPA
jgi:DNA-binding MarR family transcriptional regulator